MQPVEHIFSDADDVFLSKYVSKIVYVDDTPASEIFDIYLVGSPMSFVDAGSTVFLTGVGDLESAAVSLEGFDLSVGSITSGVIRVTAVPLDGYVAGNVITYAAERTELNLKVTSGGFSYSKEVISPKYVQILLGSGDVCDVLARVSAGYENWVIAASLDDITISNHMVSFVDGPINSVVVKFNLDTGGARSHAQW